MNNLKERLTKVFNGLGEIEVKGNSVMILGQVMFDVGNIITELEQVEREQAVEQAVEDTDNK